ncbi:MAG: cellobiose phosphorylase [Verrucomicrobia bacterium]|nr:MAG: cellobiose phosphorylase [Verrucomicrobiota bacterium]
MKKEDREVSAGGWWRFVHGGGEEADGEFRADGARCRARVYFPLCNEGGMLSWVTPALQGAPARDYHHYLGIPLSIEEMAYSCAHRGLWLVERESDRIFSAAGFNPDGRHGPSAADIAAGPGWFRVRREWKELSITATATLWCPADARVPIEVMTCQVVNTGTSVRRVAAYTAMPLFGRSADRVRDHRHVSALLHAARAVPHGVVLKPVMEFDERGHRFETLSYCVLAASGDCDAPDGIWVDAEEFIGPHGVFWLPDAVKRRLRDGVHKRVRGREVVAAFFFSERELFPGQSMEFRLVAAVGDVAGRTLRSARIFLRKQRADVSLEATRRWWKETARGVRFFTPDAVRDNWLVWVNLQPNLRRIYGNSYLPHFDYGRGGKGWRDLWQDCLAILLRDPERVREVILHNFGGVRIYGSNATIIGHDGSFIADRNDIPRTWMDHGVWPVHTTLLYLDQTGDFDLLREEREYFRDPQLFRCRRRDPEWAPAYGNALRTYSGRIYRGSVMEHMLVQTVTAFYNVGRHNLCRLEGGDWNDGLDMAADNGESVAFSAFYAWNLRRLARTLKEMGQRGVRELEIAVELLPLFDRLDGQEPVDYRSAEARMARLEGYLQKVSRDISGLRKKVDPCALAADLEAKAAALAETIQRQEWIPLGSRIGCFNGYYDNRGRRVEGRFGRRVRMTLTGQVFPLMAEIADDAQVDMVIRAIRRYLTDPRGGVRLNTDFGQVYPELGRAFSFAYGEKENGAVFSHMAVMYAFALYSRRRAREGRRVWHSLYRMAVDSAVSDVFPNLPEYFNLSGRGLYSYLTGSAAWLVYLLLTQVYGVRGLRGDLLLDPQLGKDDLDRDGVAQVELTFAKRRLRVRYEGHPGQKADRPILVSGSPVEAVPGPDGRGYILSRALIERLLPGRTHEIRVPLRTASLR